MRCELLCQELNINGEVYKKGEIVDIKNDFARVTLEGKNMVKELHEEYKQKRKTKPSKKTSKSRTDKATKYLEEKTNESISEEVLKKAKELIRKFEVQELCSKQPRSIASGCLYIASLILGERLTQYEIAQIMEIADVTIKGSYKKIVNTLDLEIEV